MTTLSPRDKPPHNVNVLGKWLTEAANESGIAAGRLMSNNRSRAVSIASGVGSWSGWADGSSTS